MKRRILVVDDELNVLQGLSRVLRGMRHEWEMRLAGSGQDALEILAKESFDVLLSDMRMPGMDGAQLLAEVKNCYPHIVRIILSGNSDEKMIMKSVRLAHQYLTKPCDAEELKSAISRACNLRDLLAQDSLRKVVSQIESLPSLPSLYAEIMDEINSEEASIEKIGKIVSKDLGMTTKVLQLVNSSFFGIPRHISNPEQAIIFLGLDTMKGLVLMVEVFSMFDKAKLTGFLITKVWDHSVMTGAIAKEIAKVENIDKKLVDNAFIAGLIHDLGKLVLAENLPDEYKRVLECVQHQNIPFFEAENQIMGTTHAEVGGCLLGLWGLSDSIVEAVMFHHNPSNCPNQIFGPLTAVHIANAMKPEQMHTPEMDTTIVGIDNEYLARLGLTERLSVWQEISSQLLEGGDHE